VSCFERPELVSSRTCRSGSPLRGRRVLDCSPRAPSCPWPATANRGGGAGPGTGGSHGARGTLGGLRDSSARKDRGGVLRGGVARGQRAARRRGLCEAEGHVIPGRGPQGGAKALRGYKSGVSAVRGEERGIPGAEPEP
jgi:hypothetical protein